jgi:hypothetical protein
LEDDKRNGILNKGNKWEIFRQNRAKVIKAYVTAKRVQKMAEAINIQIIAR